MLAKKTGSTDNLTGHLGTAKSTDCLIKEVAVFYIVSQIDCQNGQYMVKVAILNIPSLKINEDRSLRAVDRIILKLIIPPHPPTSTNQTEIFDQQILVEFSIPSAYFTILIRNLKRLALEMADMERLESKEKCLLQLISKLFQQLSLGRNSTFPPFPVKPSPNLTPK